MHKIFIRIVAVLFVLGAITHWLIIFGVMEEPAPLALTLYFHSLAILNPLTAFGLWTLRRWAVSLVLFIATTQVLSHGWMLMFWGFESWRLLDMALVVGVAIYLTRPSVLRLFSR